MKLDSKEKYQRVRRFVAELKNHTNIDPFLITQELAKYGIYDFCYITKNPSSFSKIDKKLKDSKYDELREFVDDLKQVFMAISDYAFEDDPIQEVVEGFYRQIDRFADKFVDDYRPRLSAPELTTKTKIKQEKPRPPRPPSPPKVQQPVAVVTKPALPVISDRPTNLLQKLEMLFLLRANENNEPYIREIGRAYQIGEQIGDEYVISLDNKNTLWMQFLNRHQ